MASSDVTDSTMRTFHRQIKKTPKSKRKRQTRTKVKLSSKFTSSCIDLFKQTITCPIKQAHAHTINYYFVGGFTCWEDQLPKIEELVGFFHDAAIEFMIHEQRLMLDSNYDSLKHTSEIRLNEIIAIIEQCHLDEGTNLYTLRTNKLREILDEIEPSLDTLLANDKGVMALVKHKNYREELQDWMGTGKGILVAKWWSGRMVEVKDGNATVQFPKLGGVQLLIDGRNIKQYNHDLIKNKNKKIVQEANKQKKKYPKPVRDLGTIRGKNLVITTTHEYGEHIIPHNKNKKSHTRQKRMRHKQDTLKKYDSDLTKKFIKLQKGRDEKEARERKQYYKDRSDTLNDPNIADWFKKLL